MKIAIFAILLFSGGTLLAQSTGSYDWSNLLSIIANCCGILGFLISLFAVSEVRKINKRTDNSNNSKKQSAFGSGNKQTMS